MVVIAAAAAAAGGERGAGRRYLKAKGRLGLEEGATKAAAAVSEPDMAGGGVARDSIPSSGRGGWPAGPRLGGWAGLVGRSKNFF